MNDQPTQPDAQFSDALKAFSRAVSDLAKAVGSEVSQSKPEVAKGLAGHLRQAASKLETFGDSSARSQSAASERAQQTRAQLLQAAALVFAERGFEGASMDDVAKSAGFTKGALYAHFSSKFELIVALTEQVSAAEQPLPEVGQLPQLLSQASAGAPKQDLYLTIEIMSLALRDQAFRLRVLPSLRESVQTVARQVAANRGANLTSDGQIEVSRSDIEAAIALTGLVAAARTAELFDPSFQAGPLAGRLAERLLTEPNGKPSKKQR